MPGLLDETALKKLSYLVMLNGRKDSKLRIFKKQITKLECYLMGSNSLNKLFIDVFSFSLKSMLFLI